MRPRTTAIAVARRSSSTPASSQPGRNGGRQEDVHQSTALRAARKALHRFDNGKVHSEKRDEGRRKVLAWGSDWGPRIVVVGPTWRCVQAGLEAAVVELHATGQARPRHAR